MASGKHAKDLIKQFEGLRLTAYLCPAGHKTIGYGHVIKPHEQAKIGDSISREQAERLLEEDVTQAQRILYKYCSVYLSIPQKAALISFIFNCGSGAFQASTLRQKLNRGEYSSAADELLKWVHSGGVRLNGLVKRRALERSIFLNEVNLYLPSYRRAITRDNMQDDKDDIKHYGNSITGIIASSIKGLFGRFKGVAPALGVNK